MVSCYGMIKETSKQADRQAGRQAGRQTGRQADRQLAAGRQTGSRQQAAGSRLLPLCSVALVSAAFMKSSYSLLWRRDRRHLRVCSIFLGSCFATSWCCKVVTRVLQGCYKGVTRVLQGCYKSVTRVSQECYKSATRVLQECYKSVHGTSARMVGLLQA
jgi:hypothetical protein